MEFLTKRSKLIHIIFGVICFTLLLSALVYMTQYANIRVTVKESTTGDLYLDGTVEKDFLTGKDIFTSEDTINGNITSFWFNQERQGNTELGDVQEAMWTVFHFNEQLNQFNRLIVIFAIVSLVLFAVMMVMGNHSRKVYYNSNLIVGILVPTCVAVFAIVLLAINTSLMGRFNDNYELFNYISLLANESSGTVLGADVSKMKDLQEVKNLFNCDTLTFTLYNVYFAIILVAAIAMIGYAVYRYITSTEKRKAIMLKAVESDE